MLSILILNKCPALLMNELIISKKSAKKVIGGFGLRYDQRSLSGLIKY